MTPRDDLLERLERAAEDIGVDLGRVDRRALCVLLGEAAEQLRLSRGRVEDARREAFEEAARGSGNLVRFYEREFYVLSNFSAFRLKWQGHEFDTSEAAYHWEKFPDHQEVRNAIRFASSAHEAFKIAERYKALRRPDWDGVRLRYMKAILIEKALQHEYVRRKLLETGDRELVEDSWRDAFWGWGPNRDGQNMLGKLWMEVRAELRARQSLSRGDGK